MIAHALETKSRLVVSRLGFFLWCARCPLEHNQTWELDHHGVQKPIKKRSKRGPLRREHDR